MRIAVLAVDMIFLVIAFGVRTVVALRRTGDGGWRLGRSHGAAEAAARALMVSSAVLAAAALVTSEPASPSPFALGIVVAMASVLLVAVAQWQMGASWRIGVDPDERTELVTAGLYRLVRNPIYTGMVVFMVGQAVMLPGVVALAAVLAMSTGVEVQVRAVEEPYLRAVHGASFERWASRSGRFLPGIGRARMVTRQP